MAELYVEAPLSEPKLSYDEFLNRHDLQPSNSMKTLYRINGTYHNRRTYGSNHMINRFSAYCLLHNLKPCEKFDFFCQFLHSEPETQLRNSSGIMST